MYGFGGEVRGCGGVTEGEVAYPRAAQGCEVGACSEVAGEVGEQGSYVGAAGAGDLECGGLVGGVSGGEGKEVNRHGAGLALHGHAAAVEIVEADALAFEGRSHRRDLE